MFSVRMVSKLTLTSILHGFLGGGRCTHTVTYIHAQTRERKGPNFPFLGRDWNREERDRRIQIERVLGREK